MMIMVYFCVFIVYFCYLSTFLASGLSFYETDRSEDIARQLLGQDGLEAMQDEKQGLL